MVFRIDLNYWMRKYEKDYPTEAKGKYPIFVDEHGIECEERSPYFDSMSVMLQKRGYLFKKEFVSIGKWKTERQKARYELNDDQKVEGTTKRAFKATGKDKLKILCELGGVGVPVASAILTVVYPNEYCIIDYRTWRALLWLRMLTKQASFTFISYEEYSDFLDSYDVYGNVNVYFMFLQTLRNIGAKRKLTPRQVEMALWKFDQMKGKSDIAN